MSLQPVSHSEFSWCVRCVCAVCVLCVRCVRCVCAVCAVCPVCVLCVSCVCAVCALCVRCRSGAEEEVLEPRSHSTHNGFELTTQGRAARGTRTGPRPGGGSSGHLRELRPLLLDGVGWEHGRRGASPGASCDACITDANQRLHNRQVCMTDLYLFSHSSLLLRAGSGVE